ncbi:oxidoreductase, aldo/keto reductase family [Asticcacaulis biprosthecium C19]|uniref:Oxidoreductase, aldo/keto reductase family n=1 Tax=Asticcacaulis biprosthecium C19 TaxID=715226 RepID=F4QSM2_9CAUL|nr:aldo/keto reductase [Asticcacaulis biprosthecium]EGF89742.1 oxidoreductase, aldo/keto reductase family [Asticcacaulis biprosthecium C19]
MRYRPFGRSGLALSTIGLRLNSEKLRKNHGLLQKLILTALENGINTFHFDSTDTGLLKAANEVFGVVERKLLFIALSAHEPGVTTDVSAYTFGPLRERLKAVIREAGLHWIDLLLFGQPGAAVLPDDSVDFLRNLQKSRMLRYIGVQAETEDLGDLIRGGQFNVLATSYDIDSSWDKRRQIDFAIQREMNVFATAFFPDAYRKASDVVPPDARRGWFGGKVRNPLAGAGTHAFLHQTHGWTPEELCLGHCLSQPSLACIFVEPEDPAHLEALADVPERHMPPSVPAQIEMARFNAKPA